jgi:hypothetical protein
MNDAVEYDGGFFQVRVSKWGCDNRDMIIKGQVANVDEFGSGDDTDPGNKPEYGCGDHKFVCHEPTDEILSKYGISEDEYRTIAATLEKMLSFGRCRLCD